MTRREKLLAILVTSALGIFLTDQYLLGPFLERRSALATEATKLQDRYDKSRRLMRNRQRIEASWSTLVAAGIEQSAGEAQVRVLKDLETFALGSGIEVQGIKPEHAVQEGDFLQIRFLLNGSGPMVNLAKLLWKIQDSNLTLRVTEMRLSTRREGTDDLSIQLGVAAQILSPPPPVLRKGTRATAERKNAS